jgi:hypothetical protein
LINNPHVLLTGGRAQFPPGNGRQPPKGGYNNNNNFSKGAGRDRGQNFNGPRPWQNNQEFTPGLAPPQRNNNNNRN